MKFILCTILFLYICSIRSVSEEFVFQIPASQIKMVSGSGFKSPIWYKEEFQLNNLCNLSFFNGRSFIPPYKDQFEINLRNKKKWSYLMISDNIATIEIGTKPINDNSGINFIASGYPLLILNGKRCKLRKSFFTRRRCSRTAIGIMSDQSTVILFISTAATLLDVQNYFLSVGCYSALNFDGGSSTFLYSNDSMLFSSKQGRSYPNVLCW